MSHPPEKGESREHGAHDPLPYCVHMSLHMSDVSCVSSVVHAGTFHARLQLDCIGVYRVLVMPHAALFHREGVHPVCRESSSRKKEGCVLSNRWENLSFTL